MDFEEVLLTELARGQASVSDIADRLRDRIRRSLNRLASDGKIERVGFDGRGNEKLYRVPAPPSSAPVKRRF